MPQDQRTGGEQNPAPSNSTQDQQQRIVDHFEGIDLDELPDNARAAVIKARESITSLTNSAATSEQKRVQAENFARQQQSKADKLATVVNKHNLDPDGFKPANLADDKHRTRVDRIIRDNPGIKPEVAEAHARMLGAEAEEIRKEVISNLVPLANNVNHVNASQILSAKETQHSRFFSIPEVAKSVRDNVAVIVGKGDAISSETVDHLLNMAYGQYIIGGGKAPTEEQIPNLSSNNMRGGSHTRLPSNDNQAPQASDPETNSIMTKINGYMKQGIPDKKK